MTKRVVMRILEEREPIKSASEAMPTHAAAERAKRDPLPGDRWQEMLTYRVHVVDRIGDLVRYRSYTPPCTIGPLDKGGTPAADRIVSIDDFALVVAHCSYDGNETYMAQIEGKPEASPFRS